MHIPKGIHWGNLRIDKPLHLTGEKGAILEGDGAGHVLHVLAPDVTIEGLEIRNSGTDLSADHAGILIEGDRAVIRDNILHDVLYGIYVKGASQATIERNAIQGLGGVDASRLEAENAALCSTGTERRGNGIHLWNSGRNLVRANRITNARDGIYLSFTRESRIEDNAASACRYGLHYMYSDSNTVGGNHFSENAAGAALMFSKHLTVRGNRFNEHRGQRAGGVILHSVDYSRIEANDIERNRTGLYLQNCNGNEILGNRLARNYIGLRLTGSSTGNFFQENASVDNLHAIDLTGRDNGNRWDDGARGNYWGGSPSPDLDGDGIGDWPHREADILGARRPEFPLVALLSASPFTQAAQFAFQRAPLPHVPIIRDNRPLRQEVRP